MKKFLFALICIFSFIALKSQQTNIYIVRHAEKDLSDKTNTNPDLSSVGKNRAEKLALELKKIKFSAAYSTPYNRTQQTLKPITLQNSIEITSYEPRENKKLAEEILKRYQGKNVIIAGHSNTIPLLLEAFGSNAPFEISEDDYSNIFHVKINKGKTTLKSLKY
ncbi:Broad specificity phosphatase PhoE [Chryseobacterium sp. RU37D]|uniref:phosphoglycerate mutase family protein n=1 Tax=Chryseobacterium sp. RU37D TaxID=1907397 RepID=UPI00095668E5|nr:phosphoglycerate mutase family protein [Chryseobacterium sp. RU37D]SIQ73683.1 Broad specificity phosphatase PhoE [Chryseobacterium sp. RU37D]